MYYVHLYCTCIQTSYMYTAMIHACTVYCYYTVSGHCPHSAITSCHACYTCMLYSMLHNYYSQGLHISSLFNGTPVTAMQLTYHGVLEINVC